MRVGDGRLSRVRPFWLLRCRAQVGPLVSTGLVVVVVAFLASVMTGLAVRSPDAAVRATLEHEPPSVTSLMLQASRSSDAEAQASAVRSVVRSAFRGAPLRMSETAFVQSAAVEGGGAALLIVASDAVRERVRLSGAWPSGSSVAVDEAFARAHRLEVGDAFVFSGPDEQVPVTVAAVWRPADPAAPAWLGFASGVGGTEGRVLVPDSVAVAAGDGVSEQWVLTPDADRITAAQLPLLNSGFARVAGALSDDAEAAESPFSSSGEALSTVAAMQRSVVALQAVIPIPLAVLAVCSVVALALLSRLLADARRVETRLLRSRGVTIPRLAGATALESGAVAIVAVAVGAAVAQGVLFPLAGAPAPGWGGAADLVVPPVVTLLAAVSTATLTAVASARSLTDSPGAVEAGRARSAVSAGLAVLAVIAAGVTLWRFVAFSNSAGAEGPSAGAGGVDPAGVLAPAAVLCAIALVGLSLFGPAAAAAERLASRSRGVAGVLPARQVGRGLAVFSGPVALIVLAVGALSFAAGYSGTLTGFLRDSSMLVTGAAVRADLGVGGAPRSAADLSPAAVLDRPGRTVSPAMVEEGTVGDTDVAVVVADGSRLPALTPVGAYLFDAEAAWHALQTRGGVPGADLRSRRPLEFRVAVSAAAGTASATSVTVWLATASGEAVPLTVVPDASGAVRIPVPADGLRRLVAVDVTTQATEETGARDVAIAVTGLPTGLGDATADSWALAPSAFGPDAPFAAAAGAGATADTLDGSASARFVPDAAAPPLRLVVTRALADDDGLRVGQRIEVNSPVGDLTGTVGAVVAAVPGTAAERAVLADYSAVAAQLLRTTPSVSRASAVWATGADAPALREAVATAVGPDAAVTTADGSFVSRFLVGALLSTWLGAAGCAVLALAAVAAAMSSSLRRRRGEVVVLRAVGFTGGQQAWSRRLEVISVSFASALFGLAGGVAVVLLVGNTLARLSVVTAPSTLSVRGRVDSVGVALGLAALVGALALAVWAYGAAVRRQAEDSAYREETR